MHLHTVKDSVQCIRDTVVESVISLILESWKHAKSSVGDKLKVVQIHSVIRNSVDSITQKNKLRLAPTRCSLDSQYVRGRRAKKEKKVVLCPDFFFEHFGFVVPSHVTFTFQAGARETCKLNSI